MACKQIFDLNTNQNTPAAWVLTPHNAHRRRPPVAPPRPAALRNSLRKCPTSEPRSAKSTVAITRTRSCPSWPILGDREYVVDELRQRQKLCYIRLLPNANNTPNLNLAKHAVSISWSCEQIRTCTPPLTICDVAHTGRRRPF